MFFSICKTQIYARVGTRITPTSQNYAIIIPIAVRYVSSIASNEHSFTVSYLINSCGFSPESALSVYKAVQFETPQKPDSVIRFFKNHGFSQTQIRNLIKIRPRFLLSNPDKTLLPKFHFFYSKGISRSELAMILSSNPRVLLYNLDNRIIPSFNFFKEFARCNDKKVFLAYKKFSGVLTHNLKSVFASNLAFLREIGVPESFILSKLVVWPRVFFLNDDKFRRITEELMEFGFNPSQKLFRIALQALTQLSRSTWERKSNVFKKWGWTDEDVVSAFEKYPRCMSVSEHNIDAKMKFYVNRMGFRSSYITYYPVLLSYSLEKRLIPRCLVLQALLSKGLIEKFTANSLICSEKEFLRKFVTPYDDPYLLTLYEKKQGLS